MRNIFCKSKKIFFTVLLFVFLVTPIFVFADERTEKYGVEKVFNSSDLVKIGIAKSEPLDIAQGVVRLALGMVGIVLFGLIFYAGFIWIKARDNSGEVDKAKDIIENALYGIGIIILAYGISEFIFGELIK